jgi:GNAT superfamily N-acetyltransferase
MGGTRLRTLRTGEVEALLALLDGWPFPDGQRGREFFRRYIELDPTFEPRNVWVAARGGELVSCVQIFPRWVRIGGETLPMGGIGSVFTRPDARRQGVAGALLERAIAAMGESGMLLSYLLAERLRWYGRYGYRPWSRGWRTLHWPAGPLAEAPNIRPYDAEQDRSDVERLWRLYAEGAGGAPLDGIVDRGAPEDWQASYRLAGTPKEDIWIADGGTHATAYLRVADFNGLPRVLEWGREGDGARALYELLAAALAGRNVKSIRLPLIRDEALERLLAAAGARIDTRPAWDEVPPDARPPATWMVRSLDDEALAVRLGMANEDDVLARCLPPERFAFWEADRF